MKIKLLMYYVLSPNKMDSIDVLIEECIDSIDVLLDLINANKDKLSEDSYIKMINIINKIIEDRDSRYETEMYPEVSGIPGPEWSGTSKHINGKTVWYENGKYHRIDGPAVIESDGTQKWYLNGVRHREDGPAIIRPDGREEWWINGKHADTPQ